MEVRNCVIYSTYHYIIDRGHKKGATHSDLEKLLVLLLQAVVEENIDLEVSNGGTKRLFESFCHETEFSLKPVSPQVS